MCGSDISVYYKQLDCYQDLTKLAQLVVWLVGGDKVKVSDLVKMPTLHEQRRELNEQDEELIKLAKENKLKYEITQKGVKIYF